MITNYEKRTDGKTIRESSLRESPRPETLTHHEISMITGLTYPKVRHLVDADVLQAVPQKGRIIRIARESVEVYCEKNGITIHWDRI